MRCEHGISEEHLERGACISRRTPLTSVSETLLPGVLGAGPTLTALRSEADVCVAAPWPSRA